MASPIQIDWAKATRMIAAAAQAAVNAIDNADGDGGGLDGDGLRPKFFMRGEKPPESCRMWVQLVAVDPLPVESPRNDAQPHHARPVVSFTCAARERDSSVDFLLLERLVSPLCRFLRGDALVDGDTIIEFVTEPDIQDDGEVDPQTGHRSCGVTVVAHVRRSSGVAFETPTPALATAEV